MEINYVKCSNCDWVGEEEDLKEFVEDNPHNSEDKTIYYFKGCPECKTDGYLMDISEKEYKNLKDKENVL